MRHRHHGSCLPLALVLGCAPRIAPAPQITAVPARDADLAPPMPPRVRAPVPPPAAARPELVHQQGHHSVKMFDLDALRAQPASPDPAPP